MFEICLRRFLLVSAFLFVFSAKSLAQESPSGAEKFLFDAVNHERTSENLPTLKWDANLAEAARAHVHKMVERNSLSHQFSGETDLTKRAHDAGARFSMLAENVAEAPSINELHIGWMNSTPHRNNILNPKLTAIGIAVEKRGEQYFGVQDFSTSVSALTREEQEKKVSELLHARGFKIEGSSEEARKACDSSSPPHIGRATAIVHFDATDLNQLPKQVMSTIDKNAFHTAAVGACKTEDSSSFTKFRITLLLY